MRLSIDRFGKLTPEDDHEIDVNLDKNLSDLKFEVKYVKVSAYNKDKNQNFNKPQNDNSGYVRKYRNQGGFRRGYRSGRNYNSGQGHKRNTNWS